MKKLTLVSLLLFSAFIAFGQDTAAFTKNDAIMYGTASEKRDQDALWNKAGYELYRLIGYKEYYANGIASYLQTNGYNMDDTRDIKGGSIFVFSQRVGMGTPPKIYLKYWVNRQKRITAVRITGYPYGLASLFVSYWPTDIQWPATAALKRGVVATKMLIDEKITFNYAGATPFIEISKTP
jgi:hypothetical protein